MTPFDDWWTENIGSKLPADLPSGFAEAGRMQAAKVWNAAIDAALRHIPDACNYKDPIDHAPLLGFLAQEVKSLKT